MELASLKFPELAIAANPQRFLEIREPRRAECTHLFEWKLRVSDETVSGGFGLDWKKFLFALFLLGYPIASLSNATINPVPEWNIRFWTRFSEPVYAGYLDYTHVTLTEQLIREALRLAPLIPDGVYDEPKTYDQMALRRFISGCSSLELANSVVEFVNCLECLLLPGGNHKDLSSRLQLHGAAYLRSSRSQRSSISEDLRVLYDTRSRLVHRSKTFPLHGDLLRDRAIGYEFCRDGLIRAIKEGWPNEKSMRRLLPRPSAL